MKMQIPFCASTGKAALEIEIPDDTESPFHMRAAVNIAIKARADLSGADLSRADLSGADLSGADLTGADLSDADLSGADLTDAKLSDADLTGAKLSGADLAGAYLAGAYLAYANLAYAYLAGGAKISVPPLQLHGLLWPVIISDQHIQVGCEVHTTDKWRRFDNRRIAKMSGKTARQFWDQWKGVILAAADAHQSKIEHEDTEE